MYRDILIPKKGKGFRKVSIPSEKILKTQKRSLKELNTLVTEYLAENNLSDVFNGFLKRKNACTAARQHIGYNCTIIMDIENFFDNCTKLHLESTLPKLKELRSFDYFFHKDEYLAQGFATSPILSVVCLAPVITNIKEFLSPLLLDFCITVYADDIQISFNKSNTDRIDYTKENSVIQVTKTQLEAFGFKLKESKTRARYSKFGFRRILGVNVGDTGLVASRKTTRKIRAAKHQQNHSSLGGLVTWSKCLDPKPKDIEI